jgi:hypothetical protein
VKASLKLEMIPFGNCDHSITRINIPTSLKRIGGCAFWNSLQTATIRLSDGIESIGDCAFGYCIFTNLRVPPLIIPIPESMLYRYKSMFSLELPENMMRETCYCQRNIAFPPNADVGDLIFGFLHATEQCDLQQMFGDSESRVVSELQHRFDGLPIHSLIYYQSYHRGLLQNLIAANKRYVRSESDITQ